MQLILKENVIGLGYKDDVVTVKDGYGRNYLIPTGKAVIATKSALKMLQEEIKQRAKKIAKIKADAEAKAEELKNIQPIVIATKVSKAGTVYGSVTAVQVAEALLAQGKEVDRKLIAMKDAKTLGEHVAVVKLYKDVQVEIPFTVVAEGEKLEEKAEEVVETAEEVVEEVAEAVEETVEAVVEE